MEVSLGGSQRARERKSRGRHAGRESHSARMTPEWRRDPGANGENRRIHDGTVVSSIESKGNMTHISDWSPERPFDSSVSVAQLWNYFRGLRPGYLSENVVVSRYTALPAWRSVRQ